MGRSKSTERKEYEQLRDALAKKQEEVRRLQAQVCSTQHSLRAINSSVSYMSSCLFSNAIQVAALDSRPINSVPDDGAGVEDAVVKIQSVHRGHLSRRVDDDELEP